MKYDKFIDLQGDNGYVDNPECVRIIEVLAELPHTVANSYNAYSFTFAVNGEGDIVEHWGVEPVFADCHKPDPQPYFLDIDIEGYNPDDWTDTIRFYFSEEEDRDDFADILGPLDCINYVNFGRES